MKFPCHQETTYILQLYMQSKSQEKQTLRTVSKQESKMTTRSPANYQNSYIVNKATIHQRSTKNGTQMNDSKGQFQQNMHKPDILQ